MAYEMKVNSFSLFPNDKKEKDTQPDWKGSIKLPDGTEHWFDAWNAQTKDGRGYINGKIGNPKNQQVNQAMYQAFPNVTTSKAEDEDIPF